MCRVGVGCRVAKSSSLAEGRAPHAMPNGEETSSYTCEDDVATTRMISQYARSFKHAIAYVDAKRLVRLGGLRWFGLPVFRLDAESDHFVRFD